MEKKPRLGRGLEALLTGTPNGSETTAVSDQARLRVDQIDQNPYQPRRTFDEEDLQSLRQSIQEHGILQPLLVRPAGDRYQLVAGERRLRAARAAGLPDVPVMVVDFNDQQVLEAALVENIQRTDLNPIEKAQGFKEYLDRFQMTHENLAKRLGLQRSTITNLVGLLDLPSEVQEAVRVGQLTTGHAKVVKGIPDRDRQLALAKEIISRGLSVHAAEAFAKEPAHEPKSENAEEPRPAVEKTTHVVSIENELRQRLATKVEIRLKARDKGVVVLAFETNDDFERIIEALRK